MSAQVLSSGQAQQSLAPERMKSPSTMQPAASGCLPNGVGTQKPLSDGEKDI